MLTVNYLFAGGNTSNYITYNEFVKIKSYFSENGCEGIEKFLQSTKDLNLSGEWYNIDRKIKDSNYQTLCLLAGSTEFTAFGEKDSLGNYKKRWFNEFPKNLKVTAVGFSVPEKLLKKCKNSNPPYDITYLKVNGKLEREISDISDLDDAFKADTTCIENQLNIFKTNPRIGTITNIQGNTKKDIMVRDNFYEDSGQWDRIIIGQKVRILGSINKYSYVYYNKKTKGICNPLKSVNGCNSGWVDTSLIAEDK